MLLTLAITKIVIRSPSATVEFIMLIKNLVVKTHTANLYLPQLVGVVPQRRRLTMTCGACDACNMYSQLAQLPKAVLIVVKVDSLA